MVLPRPTALRGFAPARILRSTPRAATRSQWQHIARRGYAEGGGHAAPSSDMPWLISAIAVTIPSCYFLWPSESHGDAHGAHGGHGEHEEHEEHDEAEEHDEGGEPKEESEGEQEEASKEDDAKDEESSKDDSEGSDDKPAPEDDPATKNKEDDSAQGTEKPPQSDAPKEGQNQSGANTDGENMPEGKGKVDGVQFKGKTNKGDDDNEMPDTRKREPDSKGAFKKRIDSGYGKNLGEGPQKQDDDREAANSAHPTSSSYGEISKKQQGISNTPTRHSSDIANDPEKSKKGEGIPETAKSMGTVDPRRPQAESPNRGEKQ